MWDDIENLRNRICGYDEPQTVSTVLNTQQELSRRAMLKLYAKRKAMGLNAKGQPYKNRNKINKRYASA